MQIENEIQPHQEYLNESAMMLLQECCLSPEDLQKWRVDPASGFNFIIHLKTVGDDNVINFKVGHRRLLKHIFLQQKDFKARIVEHYRQLGFNWIDVVPLNRTHWKIFVF